MILVYSTFPNEEKALEIGRKLLEKRLIACFNAFEIRSGYWWKGEIVQDKEWAAIFKTTEEKEKELYEELRGLHPYETPAIFTLKVENVLTEYMNWLRESVP
ncbi:MAG TPA: divalent-cation tolerance protein CutA [Thermotoga naphthophila]|nr:divalent-cation tolerance protein CutA [Thermotoga petrophila]